MSEYASIESQYHELQPFGHYYTYKWIGKRSQPALIDRAYLESKDSVDIPWKFILIEYRFNSGHWLVIRRDALFPFGFLVIARMKIQKAWLWFKYRIIITANVWGLAYTRQGNIPSWRDFRKERK